ncbi:hypothetical protein [Paracoccus sp. S1E-3]|uniref:hypothetical protein n=1 Tax=Paracoccus sp. S1E-3 TaxID=2756130 RepID=UPI0015EE4613|nr:hypothetical protein [Paracoccus sp. S1E-3]MBA4491374.1 hypothetical protein [Paracoccus sp. S1E-3]
MTRLPADTIEAEWVYTGPDFARAHPLARRLGAVWLIVLWVGLQLVVACFSLVDLVGRLIGAFSVIYVFAAIFLLLLILNDLLALFGLVTRNTVAWYPVWVSLICGALFTIPLMFYWADGLRPNLIYRHRFGRLVHPAGGTA